MGENIVVKKIKLGDVFAIFITCVLGILLIFTPFSHDNGAIITIETENSVYHYPIIENREVVLNENGIRLTVVINDGTVFVKDSTCKDKICTRSKLNGKGCIVCLPSKTIIKISSEGVDAVAG